MGYNSTDVFINEYWFQFFPIDRRFYTFLTYSYGFICVFGTLFNLIALTFYLRCENIRKTGNYLIINLAIADLLNIITKVPMAVISNYYEVWMFGKIGCNIYGISSSVFGFANIGTQTLISVEKCIMISRPFLRYKIKTKIKYAIIFVWLYSGLWVIPPLLGENQFVLEGFLTTCTFDYLNESTVVRLYNHVMLIGGFLIPITIIISCYIIIVHGLRARSKNLTQDAKKKIALEDQQPQTETENLNKENKELEETTFRSSNETSKEIRPSTSNTIIQRIQTPIGLTGRRHYMLRTRHPGLPIDAFIATEKKAIKNSIISVLLFSIAWIPYVVITYNSQFIEIRNRILNPYTAALPALFAKTASMYNAIIYTMSNPQFKSILKRRFSSIRLSSRRSTA